MSMPTHIGDRTYQKFVQNAAGNTAIRTIPITGWVFEKLGREVDIVSAGSVTNDYYFLQSNSTNIILRVTYSDTAKTNVTNAENIFMLNDG